jgi:hypothetical protein
MNFTLFVIFSRKAAAKYLVWYTLLSMGTALLLLFLYARFLNEKDVILSPAVFVSCVLMICAFPIIRKLSTVKTRLRAARLEYKRVCDTLEGHENRQWIRFVYWLGTWSALEFFTTLSYYVMTVIVVACWVSSSKILFIYLVGLFASFTVMIDNLEEISSLTAVRFRPFAYFYIFVGAVISTFSIVLVCYLLFLW